MTDDRRRACSAETAVVGILVLLDPHLGDGRVADLRRRGVVPLRVLDGGVGVEVPLLTVAEDPFLCCTQSTCRETDKKVRSYNCVER